MGFKCMLHFSLMFYSLHWGFGGFMKCKRLATLFASPSQPPTQSPAWLFASCLPHSASSVISCTLLAVLMAGSNVNAVFLLYFVLTSSYTFENRKGRGLKNGLHLTKTAPHPPRVVLLQQKISPWFVCLHVYLFIYYFWPYFPINPGFSVKR